MISRFCLIVFLSCSAVVSFSQKPLTLQEAVTTAVQNYGTIKAKNNYAKASGEEVQRARADYLPNLTFGAQQAYGTVNGLNGPIFAFGNNVNTITSGLPTEEQNWTAAFGALYVSGINWDVFAFGRARERVYSARAQALRDTRDYEQELFEHKIRVAGAYLNLVAAQQLIRSYQKNLSRADTLNLVVTAKALNGLIPGVDSSQSKAEQSAAKIALTSAIDREQEQSNRLAQLMGVPAQEFLLDTSFIGKVPVVVNADTALINHPVLKWYQSRVSLSDEQAKYYRTFYFPTVSLVGVFQTRASGFGRNYLTDPADYKQDYWNGVKPTRTNYLVGVGVTWNFTQTFRTSRQVRSQHFTSEGLQNEYDLAEQQMKAQLVLSDSKIKNALSNYYEAPVQVKAASDAYLQRTVLYRNGLTDIVDVTQAAYALIRAETDRDIAINNVWQAVLLRAAATGDFDVFEGQL